MAPQRYKYKPLDKNKAEIRLLYLHSSEHFSSPVRCSLFATTIDQAPTYTGFVVIAGCDTASAQTIDLNDVDGSEVSGTSLTCTSNLYVALQQLRQKWFEASYLGRWNLYQPRRHAGERQPGHAYARHLRAG